MDIEIWKSQLRKGASELAVLALLGKEVRSGTGLLDELALRPDIGLSDGSIYPLLSRMEREGRIAGEWHTPDEGGRGQKRYRLTPEGVAALANMRAAWARFQSDMSLVLGDAS
jgi:PadR family transcriptional regulator, regulatory protein PadR